MHYVVPVVVDWPGTVIAINVGGALPDGWDLIPGARGLVLAATDGSTVVP